MTLPEPADRMVLLAAVALSGAAVAGGLGATILVLLAVVLLLTPAPRPAVTTRSVGAAVVLLVVGAFFSGLVRIPDIGRTGLLIWLGPALLVAVVLARGGGWERTRAVSVGLVVLLLAGVVAGAVGVMADHAGSNVGVDVYLSHVAAAEALADGENPYTDAVRYPNGSPSAPPGEVLEGYSYPPVTLWAYALATWATGDPRWLNVVIWLGVLAGVCGALWRRWTLLVPVLLVLAAAPAWRLVVFTGWTEPLTVGLLAVAALLWRRVPIVAGVVLGLALASKQYMILLVPLLVLHRDDEHHLRRMGAALATAGATLVPYLVIDAGVFIDRMVLRPLSLGFRPDTQSLPALLERWALPPDIPVMVALLVALGVSVLAARRREGAGTFLAGSGVVLASFFLLSLAFANYWFLTAAMAVLGHVVANGVRPTPV